jgi:serine protease Do
VVSINVVAMVSSWFGGTRQAEGAGSGFIFAIDDSKVYIATNYHVIENVDAVSISLDDDENIEAKIIGHDRDSDLAVLSVPKAAMDELGVPYKAAEIGDSENMSVGDSVVAIGNAMGEGLSATAGIISAVNREITVERRKLNVMQTDAAINRGNSGGPLVNAEGEVIAINTAKLYMSGVEGMGYSLPINEALKILEDLLESGTTDRPFLGIDYLVISEVEKEMYNLPSLGIIIRSLLDGGAAHEAGIMPRDIIVSFGGKEIINDEDLRNALTSSKVGETVRLEVYRGNEKLAFDVKIGNMNER